MVNFKLIRVDQSPAGNGLSPDETDIAISDCHPALIRYCKEVFDLPVQDETYFSWDIYYIIRPTNLIIIL